MKPFFVLAAAIVSVLLVSGCAPMAPGQGGDAGGGGASDNPRAKIHTELAAGYYARGQYAVALDELNKAQEAEPRYAPAFNILGLVRAELREDAQAESAFQRAIALLANYSEAHNNYGMYLCQRRRLDEALEQFEFALRNPLYATPETALANAAACSLAKGDIAKAESYFIRASKRAPGLSAAVLGMAEVDFRQGRFLAARLKLRQLSNSSELSAQALWLGVRVEHAMGDRAAEASYASQLSRRFPDAMQTQWLLMGQYEQNGGLL